MDSSGKVLNSSHRILTCELQYSKLNAGDIFDFAHEKLKTQFLSFIKESKKK